MKSYCRGFTPLEKTTDKVGDEYLVKGDDGLMPPSADTVRGRSSLTGFTLSELLLAAAILVFALAGLLALFVNCIILNETNRNFSLAYSGIQSKMEEIKNTSFDNLDNLNGTNFDLNGFPLGNAKGSIEISNESSNLKRIRIVACFMSRNRLIGNNINNCQSSPVELVTLIVK